MLPVRVGLALALMVGGCALQAQMPPAATDILAPALKTAAGQHKTVFLIFHASW